MGTADDPTTGDPTEENGGESDETDTDAGAAEGRADGAAVPDADELLRELGFDAERSVLTRRQAAVLALRERGLAQRAIADRLDTSRANVSGVEASARRNVARARETAAFAAALAAPVRVTIAPGTDLYDVPKSVYDACDAADIAVESSAPELMRVVAERGGAAVREREVRERLLVGVTSEGEVRVRRAGEHAPGGRRS
jgi:Tfx family DNA-binding protein